MGKDLSDLKVCIFDVFGTVVDWRGSLIAPMVAHSVNNAVTVSLGFVIMQAPVARDASAFIQSIAITS